MSQPSQGWAEFSETGMEYAETTFSVWFCLCLTLTESIVTYTALTLGGAEKTHPAEDSGHSKC